MLYFTLLDQFHPGIYSSQVIDVCDHLNKKYNAKLRLVAFLSVRELWKTSARKKLKELSPSAIVLPAFPGLKNFKLNVFLMYIICLITGERVAICRNVFCTTVALRVKKWGLLRKVVYDGRSAMAAEIREYDVFPVDYIRKSILSLEGHAVNNSDFQMSVSQKLIEYWGKHYNYNSNTHVVIPCTLDTKYFDENKIPSKNEILQLKNKIGIEESDIVLVYSGSTAPWQSFGLLEKLLTPLLETNSKVKVLFLCKENQENSKFRSQFPGRVIIQWVEHREVLKYLACCDYGILVREQSDTNKVASPTKFAEYLYAGLKVLISENLGDFSEFVELNGCGYRLGEASTRWPELHPINYDEKKKSNKLAESFFLKRAAPNELSYIRLIEFLKSEPGL